MNTKKIADLLELLAYEFRQADKDIKLPAIPSANAKWMEYAEGELGTKEIKGPQHNDRVLEYHHTVSKGFMTDEIPWCATFVAWCLKQAGFDHTQSAAARSYLKYGEECDLKEGAIVVFWRGSRDSWKGHVGFVHDWDDKYIYTLGGNQSNSVSIAKYDRAKVLGYRWPDTSE